LKLIALDTSTEACSAALNCDNEISFRYELAPRRHAELILPMIDSLLAEAQLSLNELDAIAFACGPGAFTGLRIAAGVTQGLAYSSGLPVIPVSTLATLAQGSRGKAEFIAAAIDARMNEVYFGLYKSADIVEPIEPDMVDRPENIKARINGQCYGTGTGWSSYSSTLSVHFGRKLSGFDGNQYPTAENTAKIAMAYYKVGRMISAAEVAPVYLRNKVTG